MRPNTEVNLVPSSGYSYLEGGPNDSESSFPPLAAIFPRIDCPTPDRFDWALRATLRVKTWTVTVSYSSWTGTVVSKADGTTVRATYTGSDGVKAIDYTAVNQAATDYARFFQSDENQVLRTVFGRYERMASTAPQPLARGVVFRSSNYDPYGPADYLRPVILIDAAAAPNTLPYVFTLDAQLYFQFPGTGGTGGTDSISVQITGTANPPTYQILVPFTFDGQSFNALTPPNPQPKDYDSGQDAGSGAVTTTIAGYQATKIDVVASAYWDYDGLYDTESGELA